MYTYMHVAFQSVVMVQENLWYVLYVGSVGNVFHVFVCYELL